MKRIVIYLYFNYFIFYLINYNVISFSIILKYLTNICIHCIWNKIVIQLMFNVHIIVLLVPICDNIFHVVGFTPMWRKNTTSNLMKINC